MRVFQVQRLGGQTRVWDHRVGPPAHHKILGHFIEQFADAAGEGIQPETWVLDTDKLRVVIVQTWLQAHGLFESETQASVLHFVQLQGRKIELPVVVVHADGYAERRIGTKRISTR